MTRKEQMIGRLEVVFARWEGLLATLSEDQIVDPDVPGGWSIKDVIAHLWAWQQLSIARIEAALNGREPALSLWPTDLDSESEQDVEQINAWIYETFRGQPWPEVHRAWRQEFLRFLELCRAVPEQDLMDTERYPWLGGYPLYAVLEGSYEHHLEDHLSPLISREP